MHWGCFSTKVLKSARKNLIVHRGLTPLLIVCFNGKRERLIFPTKIQGRKCTLCSKHTISKDLFKKDNVQNLIKEVI